MKRLLLIAIISLLSSLSSLAQRRIQFLNDGTTLIRLPSGEGVPVGNIYNVELLYAPQESPDSAFDDVAPTAIRIGSAVGIGPIAGRFFGGGSYDPIPPTDEIARYQVRTWETAFGNSYAIAYAVGLQTGDGGLLGKSGIMDIKGGDPTLTPPATATPIVGNGFVGITVAPVPEPSTIALALVGLSAFLLLRRHKQ